MQQNNNYMIEASSSDDEIIVDIIAKEKRLNNTTNSQDHEEFPIFRPPPKPKYTINPGSGHCMFSSSDDDNDDELMPDRYRNFSKDNSQDNLKRTRRGSMSLDEVSSSSPYASSPKRFTVSDKDNTNTASLMESRRRSKKTTSGLAEYSPHEQAIHTQSAARQGLLNVLEAVDLPPGINDSITYAVAALDDVLSKDTHDYQLHKLQTTTTGGRLLSVAARRMEKTNQHALKPGLGEGENEIEYWFTEEEMQEKWDPRVDGSCLHWRLCSVSVTFFFFHWFQLYLTHFF
jgi:hypothetical protein